MAKIFENVPNFKVFTVPKLKTNQIVFFIQKSILFKKWGICCIFPQKALDIGLKENPLEHAY
jgi:hypothetical protein